MVIGQQCVCGQRCGCSIDPVPPDKTPPRNRGDAALSAASKASRFEQHSATDEAQYLRDHIHFIQHLGRQVLVLDLSNCSAAEVEKIFRAVPEVVTACPRSSVLVLSDFEGASFNQEAIRVMKESAIFDKPYVRKSAVTGTGSLPPLFYENLGSFSHREFPAFETRELALAWLAKD
jgi:hypothetical protein